MSEKEKVNITLIHSKRIVSYSYIIFSHESHVSIKYIHTQSNISTKYIYIQFHICIKYIYALSHISIKYIYTQSHII